MWGPLCTMRFIRKTFLFSKVGDKQFGLRSLVTFTNIGPDTYMHCCENTVIPL